MQTTNTVIPLDLVIDFVHHEAELSDNHQLQEWLALWNPVRATYVVPYPGGVAGRQLQVAIISDDYEHLCQRIQHLTSGSAHAQDPPSRLCRVIGRIKVRPGDDGSVIASSNFVCVESRPQREVLWAGTTTHTIGLDEGGESLQLWRKEVRLVNAQSELPPLAFLI